jgi:hypothetical protein
MDEIIDQVADFIDFLNANQINSEVVENLANQYIKLKEENNKLFKKNGELNERIREMRNK